MQEKADEKRRERRNIFGYQNEEAAAGQAADECPQAKARMPEFIERKVSNNAHQNLNMITDK